MGKTQSILMSIGKFLIGPITFAFEGPASDRVCGAYILVLKIVFALMLCVVLEQLGIISPREQTLEAPKLKPLFVTSIEQVV